MTPTRRPSQWTAATVLVASAGLWLTACGTADRPGAGAVQVVTTTGIIADLVEQVGGDRVEVTSIVPAGGDPHSYEPSPRDARAVVGADVAFSNGLLLEERSITDLVDTNLGEGAAHVALAERAEEHGGSLIPLEEDLGLDVLWLGLATVGGPTASGSEIVLTATGLEGPGDFFLYLQDSSGDPDIHMSSHDGFDAQDSIGLPPDAHTHLNWAFTQPGDYRLSLSASVGGDTGDGTPVATGTVTFAVGDEAVGRATGTGEGTDTAVTLLQDGHADVAVDVDGGRIHLRTDEQGEVPVAEAVLGVPDATGETVPDDTRYTFLGAPGAQVWILPQAVTGQHVHGDIDPHLWQDVDNAGAYVRAITETLTDLDPEHDSEYTERSRAYLVELDEADAHLTTAVADIPSDNRRLVTTHDAFGYLATAYGLEVVGFVVPNPGQEPSAAQITELTETIVGLEIPAVFVEPNLAARADVLRRVAADQGVQVCVLYGDALDEQVPTYLDLVRHNADELVRCLGDGE